MYVRRALEEKLVSLESRFSAILLTGPRQAGKTTLLTELLHRLDDHAEVFSFDTPSEIDSFRRDPDLFFANHPGPLLLDEVQHVPEIFPYLKRQIDRSRHSFRFLLSGSQHFHLMRHVTESLAGRVAVLDLWPFAVMELRRASACSEVARLFEAPKGLRALLGQEFLANDRDDVLPAMLAGGFPEAILHSGGTDWFEAFRRTVIQRDIRGLSQVADLGAFDHFMTLCAGRSGTIVNKADISNILGIDNKTVSRWMSLIETTYLLLVLPAFHGKLTKRVSRRPKWIFADSGLGLHLQAIRDADALLGAPHFGALFESFVIMEIRKIYGHSGLPWAGHHWRSSTQRECDLVLPSQGRWLPIEIKHAARLRPEHTRGIEAFRALYGENAGPGILISMHPRVVEIKEDIFNIPLGLLLATAADAK